MKKRDAPSKSCVVIAIAGVIGCLLYTAVSAAPPVHEDEAIAIADLWYAMELNSGLPKIDELERADRFDRLKNRRILYLVSKDELLDSPPPATTEVLAFVVKYDPSGFVVVSGDDRLNPVVVFSTESEFRWDKPEQNFLRYFLEVTASERAECLRIGEAEGLHVDIHPGWLDLRSRLLKHGQLEEETREPVADSVNVLLNTALWGQSGFYNDTAVAENGGSSVPTGCVATAMAIKMRYHQWPPTGSGSHSYNDGSGDVQHSHSVNFSTQSYSWSSMPTGGLPDANSDVADLMYHCGVAVEMNYEVVGGSGAYTLDVAEALDTHFRYWGSWSRGTTPHTVHARDSILGGLPVVMGGDGHAVVADGYREPATPYFHINAGWTGSCNNAWYDLSAFPNDPASCGTGAISRSIPYSSPDIYRYVDWSSGATRWGTLAYPFHTLAEGVNDVPSGGQLWLRDGSYIGTGNVPITIDKRMTIKTYRGDATIGP